jgi:hypothetical protein
MLVAKRKWQTIYFMNEEGNPTSRVCTSCQTLLPIGSFNVGHRDREGIAGYKPTCSTCYSNYVKTTYKDENNLRIHRQRAEEVGLPSNMSLELREQIKAEQGGQCLLSRTEKVEIEHFVPLSWGTGKGDVYENVIYMEKGLNISKGKKNPFIWIQSQPHFVQRRFYNELVPLLAERNGMTAKEFENYVNECYEEYINKN